MVTVLAAPTLPYESLKLSFWRVRRELFITVSVVHKGNDLFVLLKKGRENSKSIQQKKIDFLIFVNKKSQFYNPFLLTEGFLKIV